MKTIYMLLAEFEKPIVPLLDVCENYFCMGSHTATNRAKRGTLPIPAFRLGKSQKNPWFIHLNDLAKLIDEQAAASKKDHIG